MANSVQIQIFKIDDLMQKKRNSSASAMELRLFGIKPLKWQIQFKSRYSKLMAWCKRDVTPVHQQQSYISFASRYWNGQFSSNPDIQCNISHIETETKCLNISLSNGRTNKNSQRRQTFLFLGMSWFVFKYSTTLSGRSLFCYDYHIWMA